MISRIWNIICYKSSVCSSLKKFLKGKKDMRKEKFVSLENSHTVYTLEA